MSEDATPASPRLPVRQFARQLRRTATDAEKQLWQALKDRRLRGFKFRRQHPVPPYVLDFYCPQLRLAVELDGGGHLTEDQRGHDERRDAFLRQQGIEVLRVRNMDVLLHRDALLDHLWVVLTQRAGLPGAEGVGDG